MCLEILYCTSLSFQVGDLVDLVCKSWQGRAGIKNVYTVLVLGYKSERNPLRTLPKTISDFCPVTAVLRGP